MVSSIKSDKYLNRNNHSINTTNTTNNTNNTNNNQMINAITNSNVLLKLFCSLVIFVIICILISKYAFKNGILTCENYVLNTYLYIILSILLIFIVVLINDKFGLFNSFLIWMSQGSILRIVFIFIIILSILFGLLYALKTINPNNILASNAIWAGLILILGIFLVPTIWYGRLTDVVGLAGILTIIITMIVGYLGYYYGNEIVTFDWDKYLNIALMVLIITIMIGTFIISISNPDNMMMFYYIVSIISLVIFVLLLLSNHKKLKENSEKCIDGKVVPNYPVESFSIFIKMLNIFTDLIRILGMSRR